jgi:hypothetical protein
MALGRRIIKKPYPVFLNYSNSSISTGGCFQDPHRYQNLRMFKSLLENGLWYLHITYTHSLVYFKSLCYTVLFRKWRQQNRLHTFGTDAIFSQIFLIHSCLNLWIQKHMNMEMEDWPSIFSTVLQPSLVFSASIYVYTCTPQVVEC